MKAEARAVPRTRTTTMRARARQTLWSLCRVRGQGLARGFLRRRVRELVRCLGPAGLAAVLRRGATASTLAAALLSPGRAAAQPIELAEIAEGRGGFLVSVDSPAINSTGRKVASTGDVNGDGIPDMILAGEYGSVHVVFGKRTTEPVDLLKVNSGTGGFSIRGRNMSYPWVSGAGDMDGDGLEDLIVAYMHTLPSGAEPNFKCYVVFGKRDGRAVDLAEIDAGRGGFAIRYEARITWVKATGAGDFNGDGVPDILVSVAIRTGRRTYRTESYLIFGKHDLQAIDLADVRSGQGGLVIGDPLGGDDFFRGFPDLSGGGDVNGDGLADLILGWALASPLWRPNAGETHVIFGRPDPGNIDLLQIEAGVGGFAILGPESDRLSGTLVSEAGDVNGDGLSDVLIGEGLPYGGRPLDPGQSYVVFGKRDGEPVDLASEALAKGGGFVIRGEKDREPSSVAGAGDVNGDGFADIILGFPFVSTEAGIVSLSYVVFGKPESATVELWEVLAGRGGFAILGSALNDSSGSSVSGGADVTGDGLADLLIGAPQASPRGRAWAGATYLVPGQRGGAQFQLAAIDAGEAGGFAILGLPTGGDLLISSLSGAGDFNGDGLEDIILGARYSDGSGRRRAGECFVIFGKKDGEKIDLDQLRGPRGGQGGFAIEGARENDWCGISVAGAGDVNGDGLADLLIGAPNLYPSNRGVSYVVFGKRDVKGIDLLSGLGAGDGFEIRGIPGGTSGWVVSGVGDVNGDGLADVVIGGSKKSPHGGDYQQGLCLVVFGKRDSQAVELRDIDAGRGGFPIVGSAWPAPGRLNGSDINGDGLADILCQTFLDPFGDPHFVVFAVFGKGDGDPVQLYDVEAGLERGFAIRGPTRFPVSFTSPGDVDGDGLADIIIGSPSATPASNRLEAGETYVVSGKATAGPVEVDDLATANLGFEIRGSESHGQSGSSVSGAGDLDGDGLIDVIVSTYTRALELQQPGGADVVFGKSDRRPVDLTEVEAGRGGFSILGSEADDLVGKIVCGAGDVNGDGIPDVLLSGHLAGASNPRQSPTLHVVFGRREPREPRFRRGAVTGDQATSLSDAVRLLGYLFQGDSEPPCLDAADADDSGKLEVTDAVRILGYLFLGTEAPADPGPLSCGVDPTTDALDCSTPGQGCAR